jgi:hypothetical protein
MTPQQLIELNDDLSKLVNKYNIDDLFIIVKPQDSVTAATTIRATRKGVESPQMDNLVSCIETLIRMKVGPVIASSNTVLYNSIGEAG